MKIDWRKDYIKEDGTNKEKWCLYPNTCPVCGRWQLAMHKPVALVGKNVVCHACLEKEQLKL
jgi:hypothetical protein